MVYCKGISSAAFHQRLKGAGISALDTDCHRRAPDKAERKGRPQLNFTHNKHLLVMMVNLYLILVKAVYLYLIFLP